MKPETPKKTTDVARKLKMNIDGMARYGNCSTTEGLEIKKDAEIVSLAGNEMVTLENREDRAATWLLRETCEEPNQVNAQASQTRMELAANLGAEALVLVADTQETIGAKNSLEKMLAGQIGATHYLMMNLARRINEMTMYDVPTIDKKDLERAERDASILAKYTASFSRLAKVIEGHYQTLQKMRTGGRQTVTVQHQHVQVAGQAIVTQNREGNGGD